MSLLRVLRDQGMIVPLSIGMVNCDEWHFRITFNPIGLPKVLRCSLLALCRSDRVAERPVLFGSRSKKGPFACLKLLKPLGKPGFIMSCTLTMAATGCAPGLL